MEHEREADEKNSSVPNRELLMLVNSKCLVARAVYWMQTYDSTTVRQVAEEYRAPSTEDTALPS